MKQALLIVITAFVILFSNPILGQDYVPTKGTVPDISTYKALLLLDNAFKKSTDNFYWWSKPPYKMQSFDYQINESFFVLKYKYDATTEGDRSTIYYYSKLEIPAVERTKRNGNKICFSMQSGPKQDDKNYIFDEDFELCKQIVNALFIIKTKDQYAADQQELESFKPIAQQYKSLLIKPDLKEETRRFIVQATTATEEKRYNDAIDLLEKAITVDPAYPQAHFNRALLWAQVTIYGAAILEMKKYLMLVPDAADARASQDKIYEWEGKLTK
ncbi:MAG TPA: tetratricopeptide repeat protein [Chitinophagaceae bacterium]|nr:tetratricopeptide repeat protein [Chitinophagaceae bacterium]